MKKTQARNAGTIQTQIFSATRNATLNTREKIDEKRSTSFSRNGSYATLAGWRSGQCDEHTSQDFKRGIPPWAEQSLLWDWNIRLTSSMHMHNYFNREQISKQDEWWCRVCSWVPTVCGGNLACSYYRSDWGPSIWIYNSSKKLIKYTLIYRWQLQRWWHQPSAAFCQMWEQSDKQTNRWKEQYVDIQRQKDRCGSFGEIDKTTNRWVDCWDSGLGWASCRWYMINIWYMCHMFRINTKMVKKE